MFQTWTTSKIKQKKKNKKTKSESKSASTKITNWVYYIVPKNMSNCNGLSVTEYVKQNQQKQENTHQNK